MRQNDNSKKVFSSKMKMRKAALDKEDIFLSRGIKTGTLSRSTFGHVFKPVSRHPLKQCSYCWSNIVFAQLCKLLINIFICLTQFDPDHSNRIEGFLGLPQSIFSSQLLTIRITGYRIEQKN